MGHAGQGAAGEAWCAWHAGHAAALRRLPMAAAMRRCATASCHWLRCCLQTRGILTWINEAAPGCYHSDVRYTTVAGEGQCTRACSSSVARLCCPLCCAKRWHACTPALTLHPRVYPANPPPLCNPRRAPPCPPGRFIQGAPLLGPGTWQQRVVGAGYKQVCGDATAWGDGVVPVPSGTVWGWEAGVGARLGLG